MRRKILSLLLALVMVLGLLPAQAVAAAEETSWDGTTQTEPQTDSDGVYQISNGAELAWFVAKSETLKSKVSISGKLTADINLGNQAWVASTTSGNGQIINLDGDGHKVTGLNSTLGLFGVVSNVSSVVKSLSVYGTVVGSEGQHKVGGIAAYFNGTMENCVNYASVTGSVNTNYNNASWVGGLVGYTANKANKFINCANYGVIQADGNYVGGLIGCMYSGCTVTCCYNTGNVTGAQYVGGLVGGMNTDPATVTGCYNTGNVSGTQYVGGLFGFAKASNGKNPTQVNDCYSAGTVAGTGDTHPLFGKAYVADKPFVTTSGCVYLDTTGTDSYGTAKTETQLKALDGLSSTYFKASCGGYPAVSWQTAVNHSPNGAGEVTDPTCTTGGYTTYTCSVCGASYQDLFTAALGHEYCEHSVDTTCEHCEQDPAPGETTYGTLKRHCQNGCGTDREESIKPTIRYTITLPANTIGYTVAPADGSTSPVATDESFSFTVTIVDGYKKGEDFAVKANDTPLTENNGVYTIEKINAHQTVTVEGVEEKTLADYNVTVIAPAGSTVTAGQFYNYYQYDFVNALDTQTLDDGRISVIFPTAKTQSFYRVQHPDGVTYWEFATGSKVFSMGDKFEVTAEMLHIGDSAFTKDTVYSNFEKNGYDKADLYLNINEKGYLAMAKGGTYELNVFRNWMSLDNSTMNTGVALPDVHYQVISEDGTPSDVVTVTPDANNSCVATLTANSTGTAIVLVTYDAMTNKTALGGSQFSAVWPENTGVFVVTVGATDSSGIQTNMTVNEGLNEAYGKTAPDAEHDILFYVDDAGAAYSFTPESGYTVSVARSTVDTKLSFSGFTTTGITTDADGKVTVTGLTSGAHIIKVEKDGKATYQVIRARKVSYTLKDEDGKTVDAQNPVYPGDKVTVQFTGLISPMEKLSGIYNSNFGFYYNGEDGTEIRKAGGSFGVYNFSSSSGLQSFTVTIPEDWSSTSYTLTDGAIKVGGFGSFAGAHRTVRYAEGKPVNTDALTIDGVLSVLPDIVIPTTHDCTVTLTGGIGCKVTGESTAQCGMDYTFTVTVLGGYDGSSMVVKANGEPVAAQRDGSYKVSGVSGNLVITVEGVEKLSQTFTGEGTKIYTYGFEDEEDEANKTGWIEECFYNANVKDLTLLGAAVKSASWNEDWSVCTVVLSSDTAQNAVVGFDLIFDVGKSYQTNEMLKAYFLSGLSATLNGSAMTAGQPTAVRLVNGKATVSIEAKIDLEGEVYKRVKTIVISVAEPDFYDVTLPSGKGYTVTGEDTVAAGGDYTFTVEVQEGYDGSSMVVKVNDEPVTAGEDGSYKVENVHEALTITVEGVEKQPVPITPVGPGAPGTPSTPSEPGEPGTPEEPEQPAEPETPAVSFTDVSGHWASDAIAYVVANDLMNGTGDGKFSPDATTTRGMIVTILARLEGVDTTTGSIWYEVGRQWAMANGISDGSNMTGEMTREQLATMLYRYAQSKGYDTTARADLSSFADATSVSNWAQDAMQWAVSVGLIQGSNNQLAPTAPATRAQVATILMRFIENLAK